MAVNRRKVRRVVLWLACPASLVLALLIVWWAQQSGMRPLTSGQIALVLGLIVLPGATGAAVIIDRAAARRLARAARPAVQEFTATVKVETPVVKHHAGHGGARAAAHTVPHGHATRATRPGTSHS